MRHLRTVSLVVAFATVAAALTLAADFTWTDGGSGNLWSNSSNWFSTAVGYPDGTDDDATIPANSVTVWTVELAEETIGDLDIHADVDFDGPAAGARLDVKKLTLTAPVGSGITITITDAEIVVDPQD